MVSSELVDVLSAVVRRIRGRGCDGAVPLVIAYGTHECGWNLPMPLLFQRSIGAEQRPLPTDAIRRVHGGSDGVSSAGASCHPGL